MPEQRSTIRVTWLGQAGFIFRSADTVIAVDPFLSSHKLRLYDAPPLAIFGSKLDYLLVTHEHGDHLDIELLPQLVQRFPEMAVVAPSPLVATIRARVPQVQAVGLQPGEVLPASDLTIRPVAAIHAVDVGDGYSDGRPQAGGDTRFLGYVLGYLGLSVYHSGDTIVTERLIAELSDANVDIAILPINGRGYFREKAGIVGNLDAREAVEFATAIGASVLIPMHHDLVRGNTERTGAASDAAAELGFPLHVLNMARFHEVSLPVRSTSRP